MNKIVIGNLKMNLVSLAEREQYLKLFKKVLAGKDFLATDIVLCCPTVHLEGFQKKLPKTIQLGVQNVFWEDRGSYTGEFSSMMAKNFGCEYALCGHSERRKYFGETEQMINLKVRAILKNKLIPIICLGETAEERKSGKTLAVITKQIKEIFLGLAQEKLEKIVIAYEPIWSVGSDAIPTPNEIMEARVLIRKVLMQDYAKKNVEKVRIIYGGSVNTKTAKKTCIEGGMDGALVGRESLTPVEFLKIVKIINNK